MAWSTIFGMAALIVLASVIVYGFSQGFQVRLDPEHKLPSDQVTRAGQPPILHD